MLDMSQFYSLLKVIKYHQIAEFLLFACQFVILCLLLISVFLRCCMEMHVYAHTHCAFYTNKKCTDNTHSTQKHGIYLLHSIISTTIKDECAFEYFSVWHTLCISSNLSPKYSHTQRDTYNGEVYDFGSMLTTSSKASGIYILSSSYVLAPEKSILATRQHHTLDTFCEVPSSDCSLVLLLEFTRSLHRILTSCSLPMCVYPYTVHIWCACVLCTNKKIIEKNFSSIEIYWLCIHMQYE